MRLFSFIISLLTIVTIYSYDTIIMVDNFESDKINQFPKKWLCREDIEKASKVYTISSEPIADTKYNNFLHAHAKANAITIAIKKYIDINKFPFLNWSARVIKLPDGSDESLKSANDSAMGIYGVFPAWILAKSIKYIWSLKLKEKQRLFSPFLKITTFVVVKSGKKDLGKWIRFKKNIYQDYYLTEEEYPVKCIGVSILTDSDNTMGVSICDYDDIYFSKY